MFSTESTSPLFTRPLLEDLGPLRVHRVFGVIRRLIDSSLLGDRILSLYHLRDDFECVRINCVYDLLGMFGRWIDFSSRLSISFSPTSLELFLVWLNLHTGFTVD